eukprot:scaffold431189_cov28-Prasinocladus_malaysianus.AAC.1
MHVSARLAKLCVAFNLLNLIRPGTATDEDETQEAMMLIHNLFNVVTYVLETHSGWGGDR